MITEKDLQEAIAECQGVRNPNANTCVKLAAFYTILDHLQGRDPMPEAAPMPEYSFRDPPSETETEIYYDSGTEFSETINGRDPARVWPVIDELMTAVQVFNPRLYAATIRKLNF